MRISSKGRYGLAAMISMAQGYGRGDYITIISISEKLGISKIYLEQVFSLLKHAGLVSSIKGAQGGYQLTREPAKINVYELLSAVELGLFDKTESSVTEKAPNIEQAMQSLVWQEIDRSVMEALKKITLADLLKESERILDDNTVMYYI